MTNLIYGVVYLQCFHLVGDNWIYDRPLVKRLNGPSFPPSLWLVADQSQNENVVYWHRPILSSSLRLFLEKKFIHFLCVLERFFFHLYITYTSWNNYSAPTIAFIINHNHYFACG